MKTYFLIIALSLLSFALGWCANGYIIYRGIVGNMQDSVQLPMGGSHDKIGH